MRSSTMRLELLLCLLSGVYGSVIEKIGDNAGFRSLGVTELDEQDVRAEELVHTGTGAKVVCVIPNFATEEKAFSITFQTRPTDDRGRIVEVL